MPTIGQLPLATSIDDTDQIPLNQGGVSRAVPVATLLATTQAQLTLAHGSLLGRVTNGPGGPEAVALGTGLQILDDVLTVDHSDYPIAGALNTSNTMLLNDTTGAPALMPISLLRGLYSAGANVTIDPDGTIHSTPTAATGSAIGAVAVGNALVINASGQLSVNIGTVSGTAAAGDDPRIIGAEETTNKGRPLGYAGLDATGLIPVGLLPPGATSAVSSVAGRTGAITLTTSDISGLGNIATQSSNAVAITGGSVSGANTSAANATPAVNGAVARTLAAHFADTININDFGLARDGVTDDSAAFIIACQAAINLRRQLYIPAGGPILLTDAAQQNLSNICIRGDGIRDYDSAQGYGHEGSVLWFTGRTRTPFLLGPNVQFEGLVFFWPYQTEFATTTNNGLPIVYPPLFAQQSPAQNITYFNFTNCQVTNCYDFFTAVGTVAVVGACVVERCTIYAINTCFTLQNVPEVFFIANTLFTWGIYGTVVSVGPTYNLRTYTNTQGTWLKVVGNGSATAIANSTVGGIMSCNNYVYGPSRGIWLAAGTLDISTFINTSFDTVPTVIQGDTGCAMFSTRFTGGAWYPIYVSQTGGPDTTAVQINNPAPNGTGLNAVFSAITVPFVNGSLFAINGANIAALTFTDIRCGSLGHTVGGTGPYYALQFNAPGANLRVIGCDFQASNSALSNTGVQITACNSALIGNCLFRSMSAPIDVETTAGTISITGNTSLTTQGAAPITGIGTTNVHDLFNNWDKSDYAYNGFAPNNFRAGATIGVQPVACTAAAGYVGLQPSATGNSGNTRFGVTAFGGGPVSLLTNAFNEEQLRANRQVGAVNYVAVRGSVSGSATLVTTNGADSNAAIQLTGQQGGATILGSLGPSGSPVVRVGALADQSYVGVVPANGFALTVPANCSTLLIKPAATLATGTVTLPAAIADGEHIDIWTSKTITALTVNSASGAVVNGGSAFQLAGNSVVGFFWNAPNNMWFQSLGGGTANGSIAGQNFDNVLITGGSITGLSALGVGSDTAVSASIVLDSAPGYARQVVFESAGLPRWIMGVQGTPDATSAIATTSVAHTGDTVLNLPAAGLAVGMPVIAPTVPAGTQIVALTATTISLSQPVSGFTAPGTSITFDLNQGEDFAVVPYDDTGNPLAPLLGQPLVITRATGQVTIKTLAVIGAGSAPTPPAGDTSTQIATTAFVGNAIATGAVPAAKIGAANGVASLDATGHVPAAQLPASVMGALNYQGIWNATTNTPALASATGSKGAYYTVATAGSTNLDGIAQWNAGDHAAYNGTVWEKLDGLASEVISVAGRTGAVTLAAADVAGLGTMALQASNAVAITGGSAQGLSLLSVGTNAAPGVSAFVNAAAGTARQLVFQTAGAARWNVATRADGESNVTLTTTAATTATSTLSFAATTGVVVGQFAAATGIGAGVTVTALTATTITVSSAVTVASGASVLFYANTGSSFAVVAYDDTGAPLSTPLSIARNTGALSIAGTLATAANAPIVIQGGAAVAGNSRGLGAFDAQQYRTLATQVASGQYAAVFGNANIAGGTASFAAGATNTIAGNYSHGFGSNARDFGRYGGSVMASGANTTAGDAQRYETVLRASAPASAAVRLTADGGAAGAANVLNLQNSQVAKLNIEIVGFNAANMVAGTWIARDVLLARGATAATTTLSATTLATGGAIGSVAGWTAPTLAADTTNGGITVTSGFGGSTPTKWVARIVSIELM